MTSVLHSLLQPLQSLHGFSGHAFAVLSVAALKGTFFLLFAVALALALRRASAASRHLVWTLALGAILALPIISLTVPPWKVPLISLSPAATAGEQTMMKEGLSAGSQTAQVGTGQATLQPVSAPFETPAGLPWPAWILSIWVFGAMLMAARMAVGEVQVRRLAARSQLLETSQAGAVLQNLCRRFRFSRSVELRTSAEIGIPFTWGAFRPSVILPAEAREWSGKRLEFVLAHELAHVNRYDYLTQMPAQIACALFWFHPLVWLAAIQMRKERERACDDMVLSLGHQATDYAECLLVLGRGLRRLNAAWSASVAMAQPSQLEVRMKALLDPKLNHRPIAASRVLFAATLTLALILPAAAISATAKNDTGSISGTVHDPSGAVTPGAVVTLINLKSHEEIEIQTGQDGFFNFLAIPAGRYRLEIAKPGFVLKRSSALELKPSGQLHEEITLNVGEVTENITVTAGHRPAGSQPGPQHAPQRIRVGGIVEATKLIYHPPPQYPPLARKAGVQGTVKLKAIIGKDGTVKDIRVLSGPPLLAKAALDAVKNWRYQPTLLNGAPVEVVSDITMTFRVAK